MGRAGLIFTGVWFLVFLIYGSPYTAEAARPAKQTKATQTAITEPAVPGSMAEKVPKAKAVFDPDKMSDMTDFDPGTWVSPQGDTIKIALVAPFSGPAAINSQYYWVCLTFAAHDINKRGGIWVDGKKKLAEIIKADSMSKPDQTKKVCERMVLQEKVHVLWGTPSSALMKIINEVAGKYKVISINAMSLADEIMDVKNFNRYSFMATWSAEQVGRGLSYFYVQMSNKEKKFFILNQDYSFGHETAAGFKKGLKEYFPEAQLVGEDYHKLFLTDFAPYLEKVKASGTEVIFTTDWDPDGRNLIKQARQMNVMNPLATIYVEIPTMLQEIGVKSAVGLIGLNNFSTVNPHFKTPGHIKFYKAWNNQWRNKWRTDPFNTSTFEHPIGQLSVWTMSAYWLFSVMERAKSTDAEKIIAIWENDSFMYPNGKVVKMRACDHKMIQDLSVIEFVAPEDQKVSFNIPPYYWFKDAAFYGPTHLIPADKILPKMDQNLDRCKGKNAWGE
jgi:ABC-type branched-subunit amino acid transport system substrate-binding protein